MCVCYGERERDLVTIQTLHVTFFQTLREPMSFKPTNEWPHYSIGKHSSKNQRQVYKVGTNHPSSNISQAKVEVESAKSDINKLNTK